MAIEQPSYWVLAAGWFLILSKGRQGAWAEMLKQASNESMRVRVTTWTNALGYGCSMSLPFLMGSLIDFGMLSWKTVACVAGASLVVAGCLQTLLPSVRATIIQPSRPPLKQAWNALQAVPMFRHYQMAQMAAGAGLMIIQPAIPRLLVHDFGLGYADCALLFGVCKAVGYVISSRAWSHLFPKLGVICVSALASSLALLFVFLLGIATQPTAVAFAYLLYGSMQAGSELTWQMSPIHFSQTQSSLPFSGAATFLMGLRGCLVPALGAWLLAQGALQAPLQVGLLFSLIGCSGFWLLVRLQGRQASHSPNCGSLSSQGSLSQP